MSFNIDFLAWRKLALIVSSIFLVVSISSLLIKGLNWGLDFTGGTLVELSYPNGAEIDSIRDTLRSEGFEKGHRISRKDSQPFWLAGIWNRWMNSEGSELETCCVLTTEPNELVRPLHNRMPVIIPDGLEEDWMASVKDGPELKALEPILSGWSPEEWMAKPINTTPTPQMSLF